MTKATDSRQLRLLIGGVLHVYGIDDLALEIKLTEAVKRFLADGDETPVRTREQIVESIRGSIERGATKAEALDAIAAEIHQRVAISPVGIEWEEFIRFCYDKQVKENQTITQFLDWWLLDEWQREHPPTRPQGWRVKWPQAFIRKPVSIFGNVGA
jgi:hypothetical protein